MALDLDKTVDACLAGLGEDAKTLVLHARSTLIPANLAGGTAMERAAKQVATELGALEGALALEGTIGEGGMGIVHLATQQSLNRKVAVKTLRPEHRTASNTLKLLREAWVTGALEHPNVMPIYDARLDEMGHPMIVLKRIEGVEWTDLMADPEAVRERFGAESLLDYNLQLLMQVCHAAHFAHSRHIVHRDLKPENVMIGEFGEVYLVDWGIAVSTHDDGSGRLPLAAEATEVAGTPGYMAPEMLGADMGSITPLTDVYLLGAVLYELLTGEPPHSGDSSVQIVTSILSSTPSFPDDAPPELCAIARRAMAPEPDQRFGSAAEMRLALQDFMQHKSSARLSSKAERRLARLTEALVASVDQRGRGAIYDLFGACRFGFREALAMWPSNQAAQDGLERAVLAMVDYELSLGDADAAAALLDQLQAPPGELTTRVAEARQAQESERRRLAALEELGEDFDAAVGLRTRWRLAGVLGALWTLAPLTLTQVVDLHSDQYWPGVIAPGLYLVLLTGMGVWARDSMMRTAINRRVMATIAVALVGQIVMTLGGAALTVSVHHIQVMTIFLWAVVASMAAIAIDRRLFPSAMGYLATFGGAAVLAHNTFEVLWAMSAGHLVTTINVLSIWRPKPLGHSRRYGPRGRGI